MAGSMQDHRVLPGAFGRQMPRLPIRHKISKASVGFNSERNTLMPGSTGSVYVMTSLA